MALKIAVIPVTAFQQNCTVLCDDESKRGAVVDPGGDVDEILRVIGEQGIEVEGIYLTHGHMDHAGGAAELAEALRVSIIGPAVAEKLLLDDLVAAGARYGMACRNCTPDAWLEHGDRVELGGEAFEVRHCPGHTPGSVVYLCHRLNIGLVGDVLFKGSIGRTDLGAYGDHEQLVNSIRTQLLTLPDEFAFISGHGPTSTIGAERRSNPFLQGTWG